MTKVDDPDPVAPGADLVYTITVSSSGQVDATPVSLFDALPPETTFVSLPQPAGWSCITPAVGTDDYGVLLHPVSGTRQVVFTLTVAVDPLAAVADPDLQLGDCLSRNDVDKGNNNATASTTVTGSADLSVTKASSAPDPVAAGDDITYDITVSNAGPDFAAATLSTHCPRTPPSCR